MTNDTRNVVITFAAVAFFVGLLIISVSMAAHSSSRNAYLHQYDKCLTATNGNREYCGLPKVK